MNAQVRWKEHWTRPISAPGNSPMVVTKLNDHMSWGVLRRSLGGHHNDLPGFVSAKMHPTIGGLPMEAFWQPNVSFQVHLPLGSPADLLDPRKLVNRYEDDAFPGIKDLACVAKITIDKTDDMLVEWDRINRFSKEEFCERRGMAVVNVLHVPSRAGVRRDVHVHMIAPARQLNADGFGAFCRPFATDQGGYDLSNAWSKFG